MRIAALRSRYVISTGLERASTVLPFGALASVIALRCGQR
jgi:hypothetical protein